MKISLPKPKEGSWKQYLIRKLPIIMAFLIPILILLILYIGRGVFPFGENTYLRSDMYHQYAPFTKEFQRNLQTGGSLLYSWNIGLGTNFASTYAYYLASPANWLLGLFPDTLVPEFMNSMLILKSGLMSAVFAWYVIRKYKRNDYTSTVFGCFYALSSYMAAFSWNVMWLDCLVLFPLILYGLEALVKEGKTRLYLISLAVCIISNYYISIMICIFLVFYFIYLMICERSFRSSYDVMYSCCQFILVSAVAGFLSMFLVFPALCNLLITASSSSSFPASMTAYYSVLEMLSKALINTEPAVFSGHFPNIYCTMALFLLVPLYWISKGISAREKAGKTLLVCLLAFSFMFNVPTYIWHGFHFPNSLPCRYSFIYIFLVLVMGYQALIRIRRFRTREIVICAAMGIGGVFVLQKLYESDTLTLGTAFLGTLFILLYLAVCVLLKNRKISETIIMIFLLLVMIAETVINTNETGYSTTSRTAYTADNEAIRQMLSEVEDGSFYRVEKVQRKSKNDGTWNDYKSTSIFSSTTVEGNSDLFTSLGMQGRINAYSYSGHTPFTQALLGVKYEISDCEQSDPLMTKISSVDKYSLYRNKYALSLGFLVDHDMDDSVAPMSNPFGYQNSLLMAMTETEGVFETMDSVNGAEASFTIQKDGRCLVYLTGSIKSVRAAITTEEEHVVETAFDSLETPQIIDLGDVKEGDVITITSNDTDAPTVTAYPAIMDYALYEKAMQSMSEQQMEITEFTDTCVKGRVNVSDRPVLFTTIPYDKGWTVYVDGEKTAYRDLENSFILVDLEPGEHTVEFRYWPSGLTVGIILTLAGIAGFVIMELMQKKRKNNIKNIQNRL